MSQDFWRWIGVASLLYTIASAIAPNSVRADGPLTQISVESLYNSVELLPRVGAARPARLTDWLGQGDTLQTAPAARADLRFNDGSLARIGEQTTFQVIPAARSFCLSKGTALLVTPSGEENSAIATPIATTDSHGTALVVRHISNSNVDQSVTCPTADQGEPSTGTGRTVVMVLADTPDHPVVVTLLDGRTVELTTGQMVVIEGTELFVFEFDLALFYATSPLVEGLHLNDPHQLSSGQPDVMVHQEALEGLANQGDFVGEYLLNPDFLTSETASTTDTNWLLPLPGANGAAANRATTDNSSPLSNPMPSPGTLSTEAPSTDTIPAGQITPTPDDATVPGDASAVNPNALPPGVINPTSGPSTPSTAPATGAPGNMPLASPPIAPPAATAPPNQPPTTPPAATVPPASPPPTAPPAASPPPIGAQ